MHQAATKAEELFHAALEFDSPGDRSAFLDRACGSTELRRRVERLLALVPEANDFLEVPAASPTETIPHEADRGFEEPGAVIGPYRLLEAVGEGGMGVVYVAEQHEPVRRRVALKVIKPGMDSRQVVARFEAERQALAMMDHPNIARVYDGGMTPAGRPYFVMELVRGLPITEYCDHHQLTIPQRLELFVLVCRAVQHAHQKGVIHRDLKPSNVLVTDIDGVAVPKVIDFGVAKATGPALTDKTLFTGFHQFVGTPLYTSPEQADLSGADVDTRSDIYSLGVLLYELLTGTTPFDSETLKRAAFDEMRRIIREEEPQKPSTRLSSLGERLTTVSTQRKADPRRLGPAMKGELDWVVMKALEKDRRRRYETASDFAADVMRHLTGQAVEAHPPSARYRLAKFVRRHRHVVLPTVVLAVLVPTGLAIGLAAVARERDEALAQRQRADARFRTAFQAVSKLNWVRPSLRSPAGPDGTAKLQRIVRDDLTRYYSQLIEHSEGDPGISYELGDAYFYLSSLYDDDRERKKRAFFQALSAYERAAEERPDDPQVLNALAMHYSRLADRYRLYLGGDLEKAESTHRKALDLYERIARTHPERVDDWVCLYYAGTRYGRWLRSQGRSDEADRLDRRVLALFERPEIDLDWYLTAEEQPAFGLIFLSELLVRCDQPLQAIPMLERVRPHVIYDDQFGAYAQALMNLGLALAGDDDPAVAARAVPLAREEIEVSSRSKPQFWLLLALALDRTGDRQGAEDAVRRGMETSGDDPSALNAFAWWLVTHPRLSVGPPRWTVDLARKATELAPRDRAVRHTLGVAHYRAGEWEAAVEALKQSMALADGGDSFEWFFLAMAHQKLGHPEEARAWFDRAVAWMAEHATQDAELARFRNEASALLGEGSPAAEAPPGPVPRAGDPPG